MELFEQIRKAHAREGLSVLASLWALGARDARRLLMSSGSLGVGSLLDQRCDDGLDVGE